VKIKSYKAPKSWAASSGNCIKPKTAEIGYVYYFKQTPDFRDLLDNRHI
jgi:hypothetical protein